MRAKSLVSLAAIILFVSSAAFAGETLLDYGAAPVLQAVDNDKDVPISGVFFNPCNDENVNVSGTAHILTNRNVIHIVVSDITGTGAETGYTYLGRGTSVETIVSYSNPLEGSFNLKLNLTSENGGGFTLKLLFHTTVNDNGDVTSEVENARVTCHR